MSNKRRVIRQGFVSFLSGRTPAESRVFSSRVKAVTIEEMPCIIIRDENESATIFNHAGRIYKRSLTIVVEVYCRARSNVDDQINLLMEGVEAVIDGQDRFPPLDDAISEIIYDNSGISLEGTDKTNLSGVGTIRYQVEYYTDAGATDTNASEFTSISADFNNGEITTEFNIEQ